MRVRIGLFVAAGVSAIFAIYLFPLEFLSEGLRNQYHAVFGESDYIEAPGNVEIKIQDFDIEVICPPHLRRWGQAQTIEGVRIAATADCVPDNPWDIAASVVGTNNMSHMTGMKTLLSADAIVKSDDRDADGDLDVITIRLEVMELNGLSPDTGTEIPRFEVAPGILPGLWVFAPKSRGMSTINFESMQANRLIRLPAPVIRVEQGDEIQLVLENTHYLPHTIHLHGVDHPFLNDEGEGNDGVPLFSEKPTLPGQAKTYQFTPRQAGTMFYHCHVQPQSHILMGLQGMIVVEENRANNKLQTFNIGAGRVRYSSVGTLEKYQREYDLHYTDIDQQLNNRIKNHTDPRLISRAIHRDYDISQRAADLHILNGKSFPYTLTESIVVVEPDTKTKLRVLSAGADGIALHFHGHKVTVTDVDGVKLSESGRRQRDVVWLASAQRVDLELSSTDDGLNSYGPGAWLLHDHREQGITTQGINPGGDLSLVLYPKFIDKYGMPKLESGLESLAPFFDPAFYRGEIPVFAGLGEDNRWSEPLPREANLLRKLFFGLSLLMLLIFSITALLWQEKER